MSEANETNVELTDDQLDAELKALIGDATATNVTVVATNTAAANDIDLESIEAEATAIEVRNTAYAEQAGEEASSDTSAAAPSVKPASTPRAPRVSRAAGAKASAVLTSVLKDENLRMAACLIEGDMEDDALVDALKTSVDGLAKKVGDKAVNLLRFQSEPSKIQGYTRTCLEFLVSNGSATSKELTELLQKRGYTIGTARSQANQLMALLPALKVADKSGRALTLKADSTIVKSFTAATATA